MLSLTHSVWVHFAPWDFEGEAAGSLTFGWGEERGKGVGGCGCWKRVMKEKAGSSSSSSSSECLSYHTHMHTHNVTDTFPLTAMMSQADSCRKLLASSHPHFSSNRFLSQLHPPHASDICLPHIHSLPLSVSTAFWCPPHTRPPTHPSYIPLCAFIS